LRKVADFTADGQRSWVSHLPHRIRNNNTTDLAPVTCVQ